MEELRSAPHADEMQALLHAGPGLGERPLELASRGEDLLREIVYGEAIVVIAGLDERKRLIEEGSAAPGACCVSGPIHGFRYRLDLLAQES